MTFKNILSSQKAVSIITIIENLELAFQKYQLPARDSEKVRTICLDIITKFTKQNENTVDYSAVMEQAEKSITEIENELASEGYTQDSFSKKDRSYRLIAAFILHLINVNLINIINSAKTHHILNEIINRLKIEG